MVCFSVRVVKCSLARFESTGPGPGRHLLVPLPVRRAAHILPRILFYTRGALPKKKERKLPHHPALHRSILTQLLLLLIQYSTDSSITASGTHFPWIGCPVFPRIQAKVLKCKIRNVVTAKEMLGNAVMYTHFSRTHSLISHHLQKKNL